MMAREVVVSQQPDAVALENEWLRAEYVLSRGVWDLSCKEREGVSIEGLYSALTTDSRVFSTRDAYNRRWEVKPFEDRIGAGKEMVVIHEGGGEEPRITLSLKLYADRPFAVLKTAVGSNGPTVKVRSISVADEEAYLDGALKLGEDMSLSRIYVERNKLGDEPNCMVKSIADMPMGGHLSAGRTVIYNPESKTAFTAGFLTFNRALCFLATGYAPGVGVSSFSASCDYNTWIALNEGEELTSEKLYVRFSGSPLDSLDEYADAVVSSNPPSCWTRKPPTGWCSWYSYRFEVDEPSVVAEAKAIAEKFNGFGVEYMQLDHGWQWRGLVGEWTETNAQFPHGIRWLAEQLQVLGFKLGLWMAPTRISEFASLYKEHPECLIRDASGAPVVTGKWSWGLQPSWVPYGDMHLLDIGQPYSQRWLRGVFNTLARWGVKYFKLDFLEHGNLMGAEKYRRTMALIKETVGEGTYVLACNGPITHGMGAVDATFISSDIGRCGATAESWELLKRRTITHAARYLYHKRLWVNDPDVLSVWGQVPFVKGSVPGSIGQARARATIVALGGGSVILGDRIVDLPEERVRIAKKCLPPYGEAARPLDLFEGLACPRIWHLHVKVDWGEWEVVGVFNLDEEDAIVKVDFKDLGLDERKEYAVFEFWDEKPLGEHQRGITLPVKGLSVKVLAIREILDLPIVLATDMHLTQGAVELNSVKWDDERETLSGVCERAAGEGGAIYLYVPNGYEVDHVDTEQAEATWQPLKPTIVKLSLRLSATTAPWSVVFRKVDL